MTLSEEEYGLDSNKAIIIHTNDTLTTIRIRLKKTSHDKKKDRRLIYGIWPYHKEKGYNSLVEINVTSI